MKKNDEGKVLNVITKALKLKKKVNENDSVQTLGEWDSLSHLVILTAIDKMFGGKAANIQDLANADSIKKILKILKREKLI